MQRLLPEFPKQILTTFYVKFPARISVNMRARFHVNFLTRNFPRDSFRDLLLRFLSRYAPGLCAAFFARKSAKIPARIKFILIIFYRNVVWSLDSRWQRQWRMLRVPVQLSRHKVLYLHISRSQQSVVRYLIRL